MAACVWAYVSFVASGRAYDIGTFVLFVTPVGGSIVLYTFGPWAIPDRTRRGAREFVGFSATATDASEAAMAATQIGPSFSFGEAVRDHTHRTTQEPFY